jgi:ketosteroid isomerase-like protein
MNRLLFLLALTLLISCSQEKLDTEKEGQKLMQLSREWSKSAATDDIDKTVSYWSDDAIFISSGQPTLNGKQNIRKMVEGMSKIPGFTISWEPISVSVSESGDMAYMIEKNIMTINDSIGNQITTTGRAVTIWKKNKNGDWKNVVEIGADDPK